MGWNGQSIKLLSKDKGLSLVKLAEQVGVSRQTINDWIKGQVPKGNHLITLCKALQTEPSSFFLSNLDKAISVPAHRARMSAKVTTEMQVDAINLAKQYELLFRNIPISELVHVVRINDRNTTSARHIANELRQLVGVNHNRPIDNNDTFNLLKKLGIMPIFRYFPEKIKSYAFYTNINGHRVVFVNNQTNVLDLIFPLLHEIVHAIRDEVFEGELYDKEEENFCDMVANYIQFPEEYIEFVYTAINELPASRQVVTLKMFGTQYKHSLHGIVKQIQLMHPGFKLNIGGANTNLKKQFPVIGDILFGNDNPRNYVKALASLSPKLIDIILSQLQNLSYRKLGELLGLESSLDAKAIKEELSSL